MKALISRTSDMDGKKKPCKQEIKMNKDKMIEWMGTHHIGVSSRTMWNGLMVPNAKKDKL